jgi:hypothetical protein
MAGLDALTGDIFQFFPQEIKDSPDPSWREFADLINDYRDQYLNGHIDGTIGINDLNDLYKCDKVNAGFLPHLLQQFDVFYFPSDTERMLRKKLCSAMPDHKDYSTLDGLFRWVEEITGVTPILNRNPPLYSGWDSDNTIVYPTVDGAEYGGGFIWDSTNVTDSSFPQALFLWYNLDDFEQIFDIGNDGAYTSEQLDQIYQIIAENKPADLSVKVGYVDSVTGEFTVLKTIYSTDLTLTSWPSWVDPEA